MTATID